MDTFQLSRKKMAELLIALKENKQINPLSILEEAIVDFIKKEGIPLSTFNINQYIHTKLPPVFQKFLKQNKKKIGFSINEIVALGNQIEYTDLSSSAVQNWVKREVKELIGSPQLGKKYTIEQAATLFIIEDLKASLQFESIRRILTLLFNNPEDRTDDIVDPLDFYATYASIFERIHHQSIQPIKPKASISLNEWITDLIEIEAKNALSNFPTLTENQQVIVCRILVILCLTTQSTYFQAITRRQTEETLVNEWRSTVEKSNPIEQIRGRSHI